MAVVTVSRRANCNVDTYLYMVNTAIYRLCKQEVYFSYYHNHSLSGHSSSKNVFCEETMSYSKGTHETVIVIPGKQRIAHILSQPEKNPLQRGIKEKAGEDVGQLRIRAGGMP